MVLYTRLSKEEH
jgi:hypothetical protein